MLLTKLHIPPACQNIVHRPALYEKLNLGLTRKLVLISAPAGFGKTSLLINEILNVNQNFLLVLDDFHLVISNEVLKLVAYLLEHIPGNIHIVIPTRSDPALSVSRLRSQHQMVELRSSDLS
jgi:LuxR family maltose regulon positive regulatory protein